MMTFFEKITDMLRAFYSEDTEVAGHEHVHGAADAQLTATKRGRWAIKWSFAVLMATAVIQSGIVALTGSVALLADTIHNFGDAFTTFPLWIAFVLAGKPPSRRFTYGYGRIEDLAGVIIVVVILFSAALAGYESVMRFFDPRQVNHVWAVALAAIAGFAGNEAVARLRIRVGRQINSAALVADGKHARVDGLTSLSVLLGVAGIWLGWTWADPLVGILIALAILHIALDSGKSVFSRLLDAVDPQEIDRIKSTLRRQGTVQDVSDVRLRWLGHQMHAEVNLAVDPNLSVSEAHAISKEARHVILHEIPHIRYVIIHVDPKDASGEEHH